VIGAALIGALGGVLAGLLGVGGGIMFVPALVILLHQGQVDAEATSLLAIIPVALIGAWRQHTYGNVRLKDGLVIGALSAVGAVGGVAVANAVPERTLEVAFAMLTLVIAAQLVRRALRDPEPAPDDARAARDR
jgi:uncharacterized membrane protein YfcA